MRTVNLSCKNVGHSHYLIKSITKKLHSFSDKTGFLNLFFCLFFNLEAAVRARQLALQFGRRLPSLRQFLRGEANVHQHSRPAVGAQSGCWGRCKTSQPFISLFREVSQHFQSQNTCFWHWMVSKNTLFVLMHLYHRLKHVDILIHSLDEAESQVRKYESRLSEEDIVPADTTAIKNLRDQLRVRKTSSAHSCSA